MRRVRSKLSVWNRLPPQERLLVLQAICLLPSIRVSIRVLGVARIRRLLERFSPDPMVAEAEGDADRVRQIVSCVTIAARNTLPHTCLHRSLTLWWVLRRRGLPGRLKFGTRRHAGAFEAHAWVEWNGMVLMDSETATETYVPLDWPAADADA